MSKFHFLTTSTLLLLLHHSLLASPSPLAKHTSSSPTIPPVANPPSCLFPGDPGRAPSSDCHSALSQFPNTTTATHFHTSLTPNTTNDFTLPLSKSHGSCNITIGLLPASQRHYATTSWRVLTNSAAGLIEGCQENFDSDNGVYTTGGNTSVVLPTSMQASTSPDVSTTGWTLNVTSSVETGAGGGGRAPLGYGP